MNLIKIDLKRCIQTINAKTRKREEEKAVALRMGNVIAIFE
jgi:hypothetical protein